MSAAEVVAALLLTTAASGWINRRIVRLPHTMGLLVMGLAVSALVLAVRLARPDSAFDHALTQALRGVDFTKLVLDGMLAFLLFAAAIETDLGALRNRAGPVAFLAIAGTLISTACVGAAFWWVTARVGHPVPLPWALVFGALISPTDAIAVSSTLKGVAIPDALRAEVEGEALFNDGVGIVLYTLLVAWASGSNADALAVGNVVQSLLREAGGGIMIGAATGYVAYRAMKGIDDYPTEVLITLALVTVTYALAQRLDASGPLAVVVAGLLIGDRATRFAMSAETRRYVSVLWTLINEVLNSVLFLLIGLEVLVLALPPGTVMLAAAAIPIVLVARCLSIATPLFLLIGRDTTLSARNVPFLTWAGVRGAISIALALALPDSVAKPTLIAATYAVVLFTLLVQGGTLRRLTVATIAQEAPRRER